LSGPWRRTVWEGLIESVKALIIRPAALGDTLMLMPAVAHMKPLVKITLVGRRPGLDFLRPYVQHCVDYEGPGWHRLFLDEVEPCRPSPIPEADLAVAFLTDPEGTVENNLKIRLPDSPVHIFPPFPPKSDKTHVALYTAQCLEKAGLPVDARRAFKEACDHPLVNEACPSSGKRIILHPGSGGQKKNHQPEFWHGLIKKMRETFAGGEKLVLLLGPAEEPLSPFFREKAVGDATELVLSPDQETLTSLFNQALLYVGHDSGITHLAAMHGIRTIALFKGSSVHQWRPLGPRVRVIENQRSGPDLIAKTVAEIHRLLCSNNGITPGCETELFYF